MSKVNYKRQKRQRDIAKQKKREEKLKRRQQKKQQQETTPAVETDQAAEREAGEGS